ncbi:hypothetical protein [Alicyclobacillus fructus]|uniref:hypothetical protein n=1 Tax=Alicyclobacillus fructus TaxID=2816082 RepID=UPI001A8DE3B2|nr:hypothetical protein [Alicyclobacillus fructus]
MDPSIRRTAPTELGPMTRAVDRAPPTHSERTDRGTSRILDAEAVSRPEHEPPSDGLAEASDLVPYEIVRDEALWTSERGWRTALLNLLLADRVWESLQPVREPGGQLEGESNAAKNPTGGELRDSAVQNSETATHESRGDEMSASAALITSRAPGGERASGGVEGERPTGRVQSMDEAHPPESGQVVDGVLAGTVKHLWSVMRQLARSAEGNSTIRLREHPGSSLISFASMGRDWIHQVAEPADQAKLTNWVLLDRLLASVAPHPFDRRGGGLFCIPESVRRDHSLAIRWRAERRTRMGPKGKLVHRLRLDLELDGRALTCVLTAQRPALHVNIICPPDAPFLKYLQAAEPHVAPSLKACGWDLTSWTVTAKGDDGDATS